MQICQASSELQIANVRQLFEEYAVELGIDLDFQGFAAELAGLPGAYGPPRGSLLLATDDQQAAGCAGLRRLTDESCEMKRMYVRPAFRGQGLGRQLAEQIIAEARRIGYAQMLLETLPQLDGATRLYTSMGFQHRGSYYDTPLGETIFMELSLR
jgi:GNAT superfamily N-acetyltransferase